MHSNNGHATAGEYSIALATSKTQVVLGLIPYGDVEACIVHLYIEFSEIQKQNEHLGLK